MSAISLSHLSYAYESHNVVDDISLTVPPGSFVSIVGPSGCGKTTLLKLIGGLLTPLSGTVSYDGAPSIGYVFQQPALLPWRTVAENVALPQEIAGIPGDIETALTRARIGHTRDAYPTALSGGERQRAALARALATDPDILLMDEPFSALDELTRDICVEELITLHEQSPKPLTIVFVTHSIPEAVYLSDMVIVLDAATQKVLDTVPVPLTRPRKGTRTLPEFATTTACIRTALHHS